MKAVTWKNCHFDCHLAAEQPHPKLSLRNYRQWLGIISELLEWKIFHLHSSNTIDTKYLLFTNVCLVKTSRNKTVIRRHGMEWHLFLIFGGMYTKTLNVLEIFLISPEISTNLEGHSVCFDFWWCFFSPPLTVLHFFHCYLSTLLESCDLRKECTIKVEKIKQKVDEWKTFFSRLFGKHWPICKLFFFTPVKEKKKSQVSKLQVKIWGNFLESLF